MLQTGVSIFGPGSFFQSQLPTPVELMKATRQREIVRVALVRTTLHRWSLRRNSRRIRCCSGWRSTCPDQEATPFCSGKPHVSCGSGLLASQARSLRLAGAGDGLGGRHHPSQSSYTRR